MAIKFLIKVDTQGFVGCDLEMFFATMDENVEGVFTCV